MKRWRDDAPMSRILVGYDGSDGAKRALDRAVVEARDRHVRTAVASVASMPLELDAPRYHGTPPTSRPTRDDPSRRRPRSSRTSWKRARSSRRPAWTGNSASSAFRPAILLMRPVPAAVARPRGGVPGDRGQHERQRGLPDSRPDGRVVNEITEVVPPGAGEGHGDVLVTATKKYDLIRLPEEV
jgi:hypothetical protein